MKNLSEAILEVLKVGIPLSAKEIAHMINEFDHYKDFHGISARSVVACLTFSLSGRGVDRLKIRGLRASMYRLSLTRNKS